MKRATTERHADGPFEKGTCADILIHRSENGVMEECSDVVVKEMDIKIYVDGQFAFYATCSPWDIDELVVGLLYQKDIIDDASDVDRMEMVEDGGCVFVQLRPGGRLRVQKTATKRVSRSASKMASSAISELAALLEDRSLLFKQTGGVHNAALVGSCGIAAWCEDVARHSALDRLTGRCLLSGIDPDDKVLLFSGRMPREIISKVAKLGCPIIVSPGAPTSLSVQYAEQSGITMIGFAKRNRFNVYSRPDRVLDLIEDRPKLRWAV